MIEAKDLRINNWVNDFGDGPGKIIGMYVDSNGEGDLLTTANPVIQPIETFTPIKLSPEVLLACRFVKEKDTSYLMRDGEGIPFFYRVRVHVFNNKFRWFINPVSYIDLLYLHQLQNLYFALTGKEIDYQPK